MRAASLVAPAPVIAAQPEILHRQQNRHSKAAGSRLRGDDGLMSEGFGRTTRGSGAGGCKDSRAYSTYPTTSRRT